MMKEFQNSRYEKIHISADRVYRPCGFWSEPVHALLTHLRNEQFYSAPQSFGFDDNGNETLSYVAGDVYNYPLAGAIVSNEALSSAATLLRRYHDATISFVNSPVCHEATWLLPRREPQEVICHGDYGPYNVALNGNRVVGVFDFDTAHPAPRIWDIAYAVYCWAPFKTKPDDVLKNLVSQAERAKQFCNAYGLLHADRHQLVDTIIERLQVLVAFMLAEAGSGNKAFVANIADGHHFAYRDDIAYLELNYSEITQALLQ